MHFLPLGFNIRRLPSDPRVINIFPLLTYKSHDSFLSVTIGSAIEPTD